MKTGIHLCFRSRPAKQRDTRDERDVGITIPLSFFFYLVAHIRSPLRLALAPFVLSNSLCEKRVEPGPCVCARELRLKVARGAGSVFFHANLVGVDRRGR